jgi:predicted ester cyclase
MTDHKGLTSNQRSAGRSDVTGDVPVGDVPVGIEQSGNEQNKELVRRYYATVMTDGADLERIVTDDFVDHHIPAGLSAGPPGIREFFQQILPSIFSEMRIDIDFLLAEGDRVDCHFALLARHTGEFAGISPKNNAIRCPAISTFRIANGRLAEAWEIFDSGDLLSQMQK